MLCETECVVSLPEEKENIGTSHRESIIGPVFPDRPEAKASDSVSKPAGREPSADGKVLFSAEENATV